MVSFCWKMNFPLNKIKINSVLLMMSLKLTIKVVAFFWATLYMECKPIHQFPHQNLVSFATSSEKRSSTNLLFMIFIPDVVFCTFLPPSGLFSLTLLPWGRCPFHYRNLRDVGVTLLTFQLRLCLVGESGLKRFLIHVGHASLCRPHSHVHSIPQNLSKSGYTRDKIRNLIE